MPSTCYHLYGAQEELALKLRESGDLRYQQGDVDQTERNMIATLAAELHTRSLQAREEMELASRRFAWACYAGEQVVPNDSSLAVLPLSLQDPDAFGSSSELFCQSGAGKEIAASDRTEQVLPGIFRWVMSVRKLLR